MHNFPKIYTKSQLLLKCVYTLVVSYEHALLMMYNLISRSFRSSGVTKQPSARNVSHIELLLK